MIDKLYTDRHNHLLTCSTKILSRINRCDLKYDLVNESYEYLLDQVVDNPTPSKYESMAVQYMNKQIAWNITDFKKKYLKQFQKTSQILFIDVNEQQIASEDNLELLDDEYEFQNKINYVKFKFQELDIDEQILFDLVFVKKMGSGKLSKYLKLNRTACSYIIKKLKTKITKDYDI